MMLNRLRIPLLLATLLASPLAATTAFANPYEPTLSNGMHVIVKDQPGMLAKIAEILRDHKVSVEAVIQRGRDPGKPVSIVMTTHKVKQADLRKAAHMIGKLPLVSGKPCVMRIEQV